MAATFKVYAFDPVALPGGCKTADRGGNALVDVQSEDQLSRAVYSGYTAHSEGDRGHAFVWQELGRFKVVNWQQEEEGPARTIVFLDLDDAAEYALMCVEVTVPRAPAPYPCQTHASVTAQRAGREPR